VFAVQAALGGEDAGTELGVYVSFDDGANWHGLDTNLPVVPIWDLIVKYGDLVAGHGYLPRGLPVLRRGIADMYSRMGLPTNEDQILITSGAQQALQIATGTTLNRGDTVIVEDPTYRGALTIFTAAGMRIRSVPSGHEGVDVAALAHVISRTAPRFVFLLPVVHNPTGSVLPEVERLQVAQLAARTGTLIVEDVAAAETMYDGMQRPIGAFSSEAEVISVGSLSKLFWGGLRIGWIRASVSVIDRLTRVKGLTDLGSGVPSQLLALRLLPHADRARAARRRELLAGYERLTTGLERRLPTWRPQVPRGGGSLWVRLPVDNAGRFADAALQAGVRIAPGTLFSARDRFDDHVRLPFVADPATIELGVERMAHAWDEFVEFAPEPTAASVERAV
jgi:DNA-binding transcriptional MocR family regulator